MTPLGSGLAGSELWRSFGGNSRTDSEACRLTDF